MIGRSKVATLAFVSALALTACGGSGPTDTVDDFMRAVRRIDIQQLDDLLRGEARELYFSDFSRFSEGWKNENAFGIDIISEEIHDGQPARARVLARFRSAAYEEDEYEEYELVMYDRQYKIVGWDPLDPAEYSDALPSEDGVAGGTGAGPGRTVVDLIRAREQGAGPGQLAGLVYIPGAEEWRHLIEQQAKWLAGELTEAEKAEYEAEYGGVVGPNADWHEMSIEVFGEGIYEYAGALGGNFSYTILSERHL